ncbi:MAG: hypothetical protein COA97_00760 [Flavobacteriales bacterium]|nr:MAG: hypothetical protein COA97_00760 [Flavobacteriales bacterium]
MVYLREIIEHNKKRLLQFNNIEVAAYLSVTDKKELDTVSFELTPEEEVALNGYKSIAVKEEQVSSIMSKKSVKGISATSNIYKFSGLYLASKDKLLSIFQEKFNSENLKQQYFLAKIEPSFYSLLKHSSSIDGSDSLSIIIKKITGIEEVSESQLNDAINEVVKDEFDIQTQIIIEDLEKTFLEIKYVNKSADEQVRDILNNFSNAVKKINVNRRKGHSEYEIKDEYDVQDILYVILKSVFPNLRDEDPIPKVGGKSTKIDLIMREENILIEVKMIKEKDSNETHFIEELKIDFESYHECQWLKKLFCFVYDPLKKTKDISNFNDLNGVRKKKNQEYNVEIIVVN